MPLIVASFATPFIIRFLFPGISFDVGIAVIIFTTIFVSVYPFSVYSRKKVNTNRYLHLFITYAGTISTLHISRGLLFRKIAEKSIFGEISNLSNKIVYLSRKWNLGFAATCRKVGQISPSKIFADFLDRFAVMMDFGENIETFLMDEQEQIMNEYSTQYNKSLEKIKTLQEIFLSVSVAFAFGFTIALIMPLVIDVKIETLLRIFLIGVFGLDVFMLVLITSIIPADNISHNLPYKSREQKIIRKLVFPVTLLCIIIMFALIKLGVSPLLLDIAISLSPMFIVGYFAKKEENLIRSRDAEFPVFIRTLGSTIEIKNRAILTALHSLHVHDFGPLNNMKKNLYRRLRTGCDKFQSWMYFAAETGSNLINHFTTIFSEAFYLGGNAEKIGEIISENFLKLLSLRKFREQLVSSFRTTIFGSLVGFAAVTYIAVFITQTLSDIFQGYTPENMEQTGMLSGTLSSVMPSAINIDFTKVSVYIALIIVLHAFIGAVMIQIIEGNSPYTIVVNFLIMIWIGVIISVFVPEVLAKVLPDISNVATGVNPPS